MEVYFVLLGALGLCVAIYGIYASDFSRKILLSHTNRGVLLQ